MLGFAGSPPTYNAVSSKNEMSDLTADQKKQLMAFMEAWRNAQS